MRLIGFFLRRVLPLAAVIALGIVLFSSPSSAASARTGEFGLDINALPDSTLASPEQLGYIFANTGIGYVQATLNWSNIETSADAYNWAAVADLDRLFQTAQAHDVKVIVVLTGGPVYLATSGRSVDRAAFGERWEGFVRAAGNYFGASVDVWQIGSDINSNRGLSQFLNPLSPKDSLPPDPAYYTKLLHAAYQVLKDVDPTSQVWLGSLTGVAANNCAMNPLTFLLEVNAAKGWKYMDAIAYHPVRGALAPEVPLSVSSKSACSSNLMEKPVSISAEVRSVQDLTRQLGSKPVVITGLGWGNKSLQQLKEGRAITQAELEADLLVRTSAALMAENTPPVIIWNVDLNSNLHAFNALANLQASIANAASRGKMDGASGALHEYQFLKGDETYLLAWRSEEGDSAYPANIAAEKNDSLMLYPADATRLSQEFGLNPQFSAPNQVTLMLNERPVIFYSRSHSLVKNVKLSLDDQLVTWKMDLKQAFQRQVNILKAAMRNFFDDLFNRVKDSAIEWGEEKIEELVH
ncbi:MAG TPA: hypothetical protein PK040_01310 [Anaerolineaceae bacterium]|nr:hypothetical protein [Anaerolineaceae bacterium]